MKMWNTKYENMLLLGSFQDLRNYAAGTIGEPPWARISSQIKDVSSTENSQQWHMYNANLNKRKKMQFFTKHSLTYIDYFKPPV